MTVVVEYLGASGAEVGAVWKWERGALEPLGVALGKAEKTPKASNMLSVLC